MENQKVNAIELKNNLLFVVPSKTIREVLTDINDYDEGDGIGSAKSLRTELFRESGMKGVVVEVLKLVLINAALFILFQILKGIGGIFSIFNLYTSLAITICYLTLTKDYLLVGVAVPENMDIKLFAVSEAVASVIGLLMVVLPLIDLMTWRLNQVLAALSCIGALVILILYIRKHKIWISGVMIHFIVNTVCGGILYIRALSNMTYEFYFGSIWLAEMFTTAFSIMWIIMFFKTRPKE